MPHLNEPEAGQHGGAEWRLGQKMMTLLLRLLLDMHKCQSDYNAGCAARRALLRPAMCLSFCHMAQCIQPPKKKDTPRHELRAVSCECDNAHSFTHSLLTRPSSTTRRNRTKERLLKLEQTGKEELPQPLSSIVVFACTQVRLLPLGCTSFEDEPKISTADQSQVAFRVPPSAFPELSSPQLGHK